MDRIRWGVIGTGNIARKFATGLSALPDARLVAVGSRAKETADAFGELFDVPHRHGSYDSLANDSEVDVVYVSTPHNLHMENTLLCLDAGKAVLCEKPFAINAHEASVMVARSREMGIFLMEAMWTRFLPAIVMLRELLGENTVGEVRMISADFGYNTKFNPVSRIFDPNLGGGALLDVGIYPVSLAHMILGKPDRISSMAHLGQTGVDERSAFLFGYKRGGMAVLSTAITTATPLEAYVLGSQGHIKVHCPWWNATRLTVQEAGKHPTIIDAPYEGNGYNYEAAEVMDCLRRGSLESDVMSLDESLEIMRTLDEIRRQWGLTYPMEVR